MSVLAGTSLSMSASPAALSGALPGIHTPTAAPGTPYSFIVWSSAASAFTCSAPAAHPPARAAASRSARESVKSPDVADVNRRGHRSDQQGQGDRGQGARSSHNVSLYGDAGDPGAGTAVASGTRSGHRPVDIHRGCLVSLTVPPNSRPPGDSPRACAVVSLPSPSPSPLSSPLSPRPSLLPPPARSPPPSLPAPLPPSPGPGRVDPVGPVGLEPTTRGLKVRCSAN